MFCIFVLLLSHKKCKQNRYVHRQNPGSNKIAYNRYGLYATIREKGRSVEQQIKSLIYIPT